MTEWTRRPANVSATSATPSDQLTTVTGSEERPTTRFATDPRIDSYSSESPRWPT